MEEAETPTVVPSMDALVMRAVQIGYVPASKVALPSMDPPVPKLAIVALNVREIGRAHV